MDANLERVPLHYLMDMVQQYGQLYDARSSFLTHPHSKYMSATEINSKLQERKLEVVVQGIPEETQNKETLVALPRYYNKEHDMVTKTVSDEIQRQGSGVYIKAGTVVAILEFETEDGMVDKQNAHRAGGCNRIIDDKFTPTELSKQNPNEGGAYAFQETRFGELEPARHRDATTM